MGNDNGAKGALYIVGMGPGGMEELTARAAGVLKRADCVVGYKTYTGLLSPLLEGKEVHSTGMGDEVGRCRKALELAGSGKSVALVSSGDSGIYGMAGLVHELISALEEAPPFPVEVVPGVPAFVSAASLLGSPLMHDFAAVSLSDILTPWETIARRLEGGVKADFVVVLYNPRSKGRTSQLPLAVELLRRHRAPGTPVGVVKNASRKAEEVLITTLARLSEHYDTIDMSTVVIIGNSTTYVSGGRIITPRGYRTRYTPE